MKKASVLLAFVFVFSLMLTGAAGTLSTDKTTYNIGDEIKVTATGTGKDWVGIYPEGDVPGTDVSIFWYYVESDTTKSGDTITINQTAFTNGRDDYTSEELPTGKYVVYLFENDGYTVLQSIDITVVDEPITESETESEEESSEIPSDTEVPETGDSGILFIALLTIAASAFVTAFRKSKN